MLENQERHNRFTQFWNIILYMKQQLDILINSEVLARQNFLGREFRAQRAEGSLQAGRRIYPQYW
jgi:hypothetical protein